MVGVIAMNELSRRIRETRKQLHLSQDSVAHFLEINRSAVVEIESGRRKVSAEELGRYSQLYKISMEKLLYGTSIKTKENDFLRNFEELDNDDQREILNLIKFKTMMKDKK